MLSLLAVFGLLYQSQAFSPSLNVPNLKRATSPWGIFDSFLGTLGVEGESRSKSKRKWTNEVVKVENGIRHKRLGDSGLIVSEVQTKTPTGLRSIFLLCTST